MISRRQFGWSALTAAACRWLPAQTVTTTTRPNLLAVDHDRILAGAARALARTLPAQGSDSLTVDSPAYLDFTLDVPALAAASLVDPASAARYGARAAELLNLWLAALPAAPTLNTYEALLPRCLLAEVAQALPFLTLSEQQRSRALVWFSSSLAYLLEDRTALLARDAHDHHASSWLLQTAAFARLMRAEAALANARHRFKTQTIRAQIAASGFFPHELTTANPFRNSLFNLDLLAGAVQLLSTPFESLWDFELQDGPGMRAAVARHVPFIAAPQTWPYPVDSAHFRLLPARRPALLFAARAYSDTEYAKIWRGLQPDPTDPDILRTFPIRQPILWLPLQHAAG